jgi:hypothetical protein
VTALGQVLLAVQHRDGRLTGAAGEPVPMLPGDVLVCVAGACGDSAVDRSALLALLHRYRGTGAQVLVEAVEQHVVERAGNGRDFVAVAVEYRS